MSKLPTYFAHPTAVIDDGASIGSGCKIWHFSHVMGDGILGPDCILGQNVFIGKGAVLGAGVKVQNNVSIYDGVVCEDRVFIGPSAVFTNVINPRSFIERKDEYRKTLVRFGATIGANATILCGVEIGTFALIGAGSVITKDVPDFALVVGNPGKQMGWVSEAGHRLSFDASNRAICPENGTVYELREDKVTKI